MFHFYIFSIIIFINISGGLEMDYEISKNKLKK